MDNPRNKFMLNSTFDRANQLQQMLATEVKDSLSLTTTFSEKNQNLALSQMSMLSFLKVPPQLTRGKIALLLNVTWPKYHFAVKTTNMLPYVLLNLLAML